MNTGRRAFLKRSLVAGCGAVAAPILQLSCSSGREYDLLIRNGQIIDGTGTAPFTGDVGIVGETIAALGKLEGAWAPKIIDAAGLVVTPGFVDIHSHTDLAVLRNPLAESKIRQGVTLDIGGNCGGAPFPSKKTDIETVRKASECSNFADLVGKLNASRFAINVAFFAGQGSIRALVLGNAAREPEAGELALMQDLLRRAMEQGALGLSTGLEYRPSGYAETPEVIALCKVVAELGGVYATHMRSEDEKLIEAVDEAIQIARESGVSLQISHLKAAGKPNWHKMEEVIETIEKARAEGLDIHCDRYPYLAYSTGLGFFYPGWAHEGGSAEFTGRLENMTDRRRMKKETMVKVVANGGWETVMIAGVRKDESRPYIGRRIDELARDENIDPYDFACNLLAAEGGRVSIVGYGMDEENTARVLSLSYVMVASDGSAMSAERARQGQPHPRSFGTFPRAIRKYCLDNKIIPLQEMIRKMTSLPAQKLKLKDRGMIREGYIADITVFDPDRIRDKATYLEPWQYAEGFTNLIVNGQVVIEQDRQTENLPGRVVLKS